MKNKDRVVKHPSSRKLEGDIWARFQKMQQQHHNAAQKMWLGALCTFTDDEIRAIGDMLSPNDFSLLKLAGRKIEMPPAVKRIIND